MTKYRKKPIEVEAWQVGSDPEPPDWLSGDCQYRHEPFACFLYGWGPVELRWWIVKDSEDKYAYSPEVFEQLFEVAE